MKNILVQDNNSHWYVIPKDKEPKWNQWCNLDSDDEASWEAPDFAEEVWDYPTLVEFTNYIIISTNIVSPNWVYVAVHLSSETEEQVRWYCAENMPGMKINDDLHSTLIFSKKPKEERLKRKQFKWEWKFKKFSKFWDDWASIVIELDSEDMKGYNRELVKENWFISDFDEYLPHISISYEWQDIDIDNLPPLDIVYNLEHDFIEDIDDEYMDEKKEEEEDVWFIM